MVVVIVLGLVQPGGTPQLSAQTLADPAVAPPLGVTAPVLTAPALAAPADGRSAPPDPAAALASLRTATTSVQRIDQASLVGLPLEQLAGSVSDLDRQMAAVGALAEAARQDLAVAEVDRDHLARAVADTQRRIDDLRAEVADQAIDLYISPRADALDAFVGSSDLDVSVRRQGLMRTLIEANRTAVDRLEVAKQDLLALQTNLEDAERRQVQLAEQLDAADERLGAAASARTKVAVGLAARIAALDHEIVGLEAGQPQLLRIVSQAELEAEEQASRRLSDPIDAAITSEYGPRWGRMHFGVDFESDIGVPVMAAKGGVVLEADWIAGYGQTVVIDHGGGLTTLYAHLSEFDVAAGQRVERGALVGAVGVTGNSTGPHLHFETREGNQPVDPRKYLS